jgi:outer membrane protein OmpA-like peptidoglycan-associated protein
MTIMKNLKILLSLSVCLVFIGIGKIYAQSGINNIPEGKYLVIGSFRIEKNAIGFTEYVKSMDKYDVTMAYHPVTKFYHVYIKGYGPNERGFDDVTQMRRETEFIDTWYMVVTPYKVNQEPAAQIEEEKTADVKETTPLENQKTQEPKKSEWVKVTSGSTPTQTENPTTTDSDSTISDQNANWVKATTLTVGNGTAPQPKTVPKTYNQGGKYKFFFNTYYTKNFKEIKGPVDIINPKSLKLLRTAQSLELVSIADPNNGTHSVQLIANIFGYKKVQHDINMEEPLDSINAEFFHFQGDTLIADFPLQRYDVGDIATMYNVFFFKDAVIMKPISKFELNSLVDMLKENDALRIKIHGHTNGKAAGKIILLPEGADDYFTLNQEIIEDKGSAKKLSLQRSNIIKRYLMSYGIDESRMEVIGWGGKKPIYDKFDKLAIKNVRVEIEILDQ